MSYYFATNAAEASMANQTTPWIQSWLTCLFANNPNGQAACTHIAQQNLPNDHFSESVFTMFYTCGIWASVCVGSSPAMIREFWETYAPRWVVLWLRKYWIREEKEKSPAIMRLKKNPISTGGTITSQNTDVG
ncbi:hypothetical protein HK102_000791 [Quaeritorhiza haematococci]|nr:hypothetical protein HK102_000791 [Quaeritorhiza haematococci]